MWCVSDHTVAVIGSGCWHISTPGFENFLKVIVIANQKSVGRTSTRYSLGATLAAKEEGIKHEKAGGAESRRRLSVVEA